MKNGTLENLNYKQRYLKKRKNFSEDKFEKKNPKYSLDDNNNFDIDEGIKIKKQVKFDIPKINENNKNKFFFENKENREIFEDNNYEENYKNNFNKENREIFEDNYYDNFNEENMDKENLVEFIDNLDFDNYINDYESALEQSIFDKNEKKQFPINENNSIDLEKEVIMKEKWKEYFLKKQKHLKKNKENINLKKNINQNNSINLENSNFEKKWKEISRKKRENFSQDFDKNSKTSFFNKKKQIKKTYEIKNTEDFSLYDIDKKNKLDKKKADFILKSNSDLSKIHSNKSVRFIINKV